MATGMNHAPNTGRRCLGAEDGRPSQQHAANNGQRHFHVLNIIQRAEPSSTIFGLCLLIFGFRVGRADFLEILGRVLVKILLAIGAAEFDFLALINEDIGLAHFIKLVAGNGAGGQQVWFRRRAGCVRGPARNARRG